MYLFQLYQRAISAIDIEIYIPLCIYFNLSLQINTTAWAWFTFHYVSISTKFRLFNFW